MNPTVATYFLYLLISIGLTLWVGRGLVSNGRVFLIDVFGGNKAVADAVNRLLAIGFYLVNFGFVALWLRIDEVILGPQMAIEALASKIGFVLLVLGGIHFINLYVFSRMRQRATTPATPAAPATLAPEGRVAGKVQ
ncbi:MAG: hypothetical protein MUD01_25650 [Chloroflexaceae bacterium]|jgi:hypothetical protein|nr:hypothetical protein [Chloroflexaceae bacterium]